MFLDLTRSQELLNNSMSKIESFIKCIKQESTECDQLIDTLEVAKFDYDDQNSEIKTVAQVKTIYLLYRLQKTNIRNYFRHFPNALKR